MRVAVAALILAASLQGCAFVAMTAAGFVGTVGGNLVADHLERADGTKKRDCD